MTNCLLELLGEGEAAKFELKGDVAEAKKVCSNACVAQTRYCLSDSLQGYLAHKTC